MQVCPPAKKKEKKEKKKKKKKKTTTTTTTTTTNKQTNKHWQSLILQPLNYKTIQNKTLHTSFSTTKQSTFSVKDSNLTSWIRKSSIFKSSILFSTLSSQPNRPPPIKTKNQMQKLTLLRSFIDHLLKLLKPNVLTKSSVKRHITLLVVISLCSSPTSIAKLQIQSILFVCGIEGSFFAI